MPGNTHHRVALGILWVARIWGTAILAFVLFMLVTSLFGEWGEGLRNGREVLTFLMFPVSTVVGLSLAWKREAPGGLITVTGLLAAFALRPELIHMPFFSIGVLLPGVLYLLYAGLRRKA